MKEKLALWGSLTCFGLCVHLGASRTFALVWVANSYAKKSWLQKQFKLFGLFKVVFLPAPARQEKSYVPLYVTILKEAGSKQAVKWAWGPSWLSHRMLRVASWKSCNLWESTSGLKNETLHVTNHFRFPWAPSALHCLVTYLSHKLSEGRSFFFYPICSIPSTNRFQLRLVGVVIMEIIARIRFTVEPP